MKTRDELIELRGLDEGELEEKVTSTEEELMNLRFRHASGQLEQTSQLKTLRRRVARMRGLISEKRAEPSEQESAAE